ncbi:hypothetical protein E2562_006167 [Oryza meyeriana var. granulata]|uniref:F-box domain-containing protein n=1 Tax=Oryza meyeriana var. granulata TaxID=110450 RepID=A0A6G1CNM8_9ORYZ|nr:hypothetical protein E2562_006167 [Oryza meyeriana var. granulata]
MAGAAVSTWPDLPADLLREISGRLPEAADFVRFHAVCKAWRGAVVPEPHDPRPLFFPWLAGPCRYEPTTLWLEGDHAHPDDDKLLFRSIFHKNTFRVPRASCLGETCAVRGTDGTGGRVLTIGRSDGASLLNLLTGAATHLLRVVIGNGAVLLCEPYTIHNYCAAILRPGDDAWTSVHTYMDSYTVSHWNQWSGTFHDGKIVNAGSQLSKVGMLTIAPGDVSVSKLDKRLMLRLGNGPPLYGYFFELGDEGELMWAYVDVAALPALELDHRRRLRGADLVGSGVVTLSVYSLEKMSGRWVK